MRQNKRIYLLVNYQQTPAQSPFKGHLPWSRGCPLHRGSTVIKVLVILAPVVQTLDRAIHRIKIYPVDNAIGFPNTYPLDSDLSGG